ncbi:MAG: isochorismate synthase MenF [Actinomycetes bacterium]
MAHLTARWIADGHVPRAPETAFLTPGTSLWGCGRALQIDLPAPWPDHVGMITEVLAGIEVADAARIDDATVAGPVAFAALPYDRDAPASFVVPALLTVRSIAGTCASISFDGVTDDDRAPLPLPPGVRFDAVTDPAVWCATVETATAAIRQGEFTKVVLARELVATASGDFDPTSVLERFAHAHPGALTYLVDGFVGASPELLVARTGDVVRAQPMAGTTPRTGDATVDDAAAQELLRSEKNRAEHQITIDVVHDALLGWCSYLDAEPSPVVVPAGPVQHLATKVEGRLSHPLPSVLDMVAALHPTPAVGGWPVGAALAAQRRLEPNDRGRYGGPVGWVDASGNGSFAVGIRGAQLAGNTARLFAGVGVVADSDPASELAETEAKFRAAISALTA